MRYFLECLNGSLKGKRVPLRPGRAVTFGRDRASTARIHDKKLSRIHCQVEVNGDEVVVTDLNSTNGTYVNGSRIESRRIRPGDRVSLGRVEMALVQEEGDATVEEPRASLEHETVGRCQECGAAVTEGDLDAGLARRVRSRVYCPACCARFSGSLSEQLDETDAILEGEGPLVDDLAPGVVVGGNRIVQRLREGQYGPVYLAEQEATGRQVALQILRVGFGEWTRKFVNAIYASGQLVHNNVVLIYDSGEMEDSIYVSREYVDGESLALLLDKERTLAPARALGIAIGLAHALKHAKERNIAHGAVAPCNILLAKDGTAKLANFGIGALSAPGLPGCRDDVRILPYLAPEFVRDRLAVPSFAADCYSVGAVFYHMLSGRAPFEGPTAPELQSKVVSGEPPSLAHVAPGAPKAAAQVIERCMARIASARYQQPKELLFDLEETVGRGL